MRSLKPVRWTVEQASPEFDINPRTLSKRLKLADIQAGEDGKFSTAQICAAVFGDYAGERLRNEKLKADLLQIELDQKQGKLIPADLARESWTDVCMAMVQKIKASPLDAKTKHDVLLDLRSIDVDTIVRKRSQSRPRAKKGD